MDNCEYYIKARNYEILINALRAAAELGYGGKKLRFDDDLIDTAFRIVLPAEYEETLGTLQTKEGEGF